MLYSKTIRPLSGYVVVEPVESDNKTSYGLELPSDNQERPSVGKVIAVGTAYLHESGESVGFDGDVGDLVAFHRYGGQELEVDDVKYQLVPFDKVFAVLEERVDDAKNND